MTCLPPGTLAAAHREAEAAARNGVAPRATVVVLGARNEGRLWRLAEGLADGDVPHVLIREPDAPYNGQLMAIGVMPGPWAELRPLFRSFDILRFWEPGEPAPDTEPCLIHNFETACTDCGVRP